MSDTTAGREPDPLLAIDRALDESERAAFLAYVADHWPRLVGAEPADVLDMTTDHDLFLDKTEPFYAAHPDELRGARGVTAGLHTLIILGQELTVANLVKLLIRAGLIPQTTRTTLPWISVTLPPVRAVAGWQAAGEHWVYLTGRKDGGSGAFLCRWPRIARDHPPVWDMTQACRTVADVSTPDEGRRMAELFEVGEDIPELGWFHGAHTAQVTS